MTEHDDIVSALSHIPAHDRDTWVCMGMAVKHELGEAGFPTWDQWSQSADNYQVKAAKAVWKSIKASGKVTIASLFAEAIKHGWQPSKPYTPPTPEQRAQMEEQRKAAAELAEQLEREGREAAKRKAADLWEKGHDVAADHPYLLAKGLTQPEGMKQLRDMLLLPIRCNGELVNLQIIGADGSKRFLTGGQVKGGSLVLGKLQGAAEAILCEGWATACSIREATGYEVPIIIGWNAGNLPVIAEAMGKALPDLPVIVAGDLDASGTGQKAAQKAALVHGRARWCIPAFTDEQRTQHQQQAGKLPSDFNDLHQLAGLDAVREQLENASFSSGITDNLGEVNLKGFSASTVQNLPDPAQDEDAYIRHLASLKELDYGRIRKAAAEALGGVPLSMLDKLVNVARRELAEAADDTGTVVLFDDVEPWPTPVNGAGVLDEAYGLLCRYVIADRETLRAAALWSALTWFSDAATVLPLALITAPEKGCGKSTLLAALAKLSSRPLWASNVTPAALFRAVEKWKPALFIDEADTFMRDNPELVGIINSGHTRDTAYVIRTVGDAHEPRQFSTWGAKAISGIGAHGISETIASRSIILMMRRKTLGERCESLRHPDREAFQVVKRQLARWADDHSGKFAALRPSLEGLSNRAADNWEPLLALADLAGGDWPKLARHAAMRLNGNEEEAPSLNQELLGDIKAVFDRTGSDSIFTATLLDELCKDEESAWATYNRGKPVTPRQLSKRLHEFGIKPKQIWARGEGNRNGYELDQFKDAFSRYLAAGGNLSSRTLEPNNGAGSSRFLSSRASSTLEDEKTLQANNGAGSRVLEDKTPLLGDEGEKDGGSDHVEWF